MNKNKNNKDEISIKEILLKIFILPFMTGGEKKCLKQRIYLWGGTEPIKENFVIRRFMYFTSKWNAPMARNSLRKEI